MQPTLYEIVQALVRTDGNLELTAERLKITPGDILDALSSDPHSFDILSNQIRICALLNVFRLIPMARIACEASLSNLEPYEAVKTFTQLLQMINQMNTGVTQNSTLNMTEIIMKVLPPQVRDALVVLSDQPKMIEG